jgi:hypothetical protein
MQRIEIKPLEGIVIENIGPILLGHHISELYKLLGPPTRVYARFNQLFYDALEVRIDLDQSQKIVFIEFIYGPYPQRTELSIYGVNPFTIGADALLKTLSLHNNGEIESSEAPNCYGFLNTSVGVWRERTPEDFDPMIREMNLADIALDGPDTDATEFKKAQNFWTIGIGVPNYYNNNYYNLAFTDPLQTSPSAMPFNQVFKNLIRSVVRLFR